MRYAAALGFLPILIVALSCGSSSQPEVATANGSGDAPSGSGNSGGMGEPGSPSTDGSGAAESPGVVAPSLGDPGNCCQAHGARGCENEAVEECVCAEGSYCCSTAWDTACVRAVDELGCGICPIVMSVPESSAGGAGGQPGNAGGAAAIEEPPAPGSGEWSSCCEKQPHAGCGDALVEECVCYVDAYCCEKKWDRYCASEAETLGCASCSTFNGEGGSGGEPASGAGGMGGSL